MPIKNFTDELPKNYDPDEDYDNPNKIEYVCCDIYAANNFDMSEPKIKLPKCNGMFKRKICVFSRPLPKVSGCEEPSLVFYCEKYKRLINFYNPFEAYYVFQKQDWTLGNK